MATLKDIAKECGVSTATVSYVVNGGPRSMRPATRDRILRAITEVGYHPNAHARGLRGARTETVGVVFDHVAMPFDNVYIGPVLEGIIAGTIDRHLATMIFTGLSWDEAEMTASKLCDGRCDGFIVVAPLKESRVVAELVARKVPLVVVGTHPADVDVSTVDADNVEGGRIATKYLIDLGHRKIAIVSSRLGRNSCVDERLDGYRRALQQAGLSLDESLIAVDPLPEGAAYTAILDLLSDPARRPTALFCTEDSVAADAIRAAKELGLRVPVDVSVVGFNDVRVAPLMDPPLTTIRQPMRSIGAQAVELLWHHITAKGSDAIRRDLAVELIERSSTARPKSPHQDLLPTLFQ